MLTFCLDIHYPTVATGCSMKAAYTFPNSTSWPISCRHGKQEFIILGYPKPWSTVLSRFGYWYWRFLRFDNNFSVCHYHSLLKLTMNEKSYWISVDAVHWFFHLKAELVICVHFGKIAGQLSTKSLDSKHDEGNGLQLLLTESQQPALWYLGIKINGRNHSMFVRVLVFFVPF